ncbi:hypothetical protein KI387_037894 [Taxus chinensis]|uniref:Protein kinase domain-containing protein n=1 Tax=Taxus chinensis TaxID=29808 RepID=A0AA38FU06_TAXCH|nr:hypothetical protein KI387_037894 [Taxus chinensis]
MEHACCDSPREWVRGSVIGVGSFGIVSLAMDKATGELLAVKSVECKEERKGELVAIENEINILQKLDSPWIVKFLGENYSEDGGVCRRNLLMEYISGGSVADVVQRFGGGLEESVIRNYTRSIVKGIEYLHSQGIVHCDIKGKNVLVGDSGVKLADFGSAEVMASESKVELSGTPLWMAPEVVNQEERGAPSDIWSFGCTVVEMATGSPPWSNISKPLLAMYTIGCSDELPEFPKKLSVEGHDFLEKCLRRDPKQRWTSTQLLSHPFLSESIQQGPVSPTSILSFHKAEKQLDDSCSCETFAGTTRTLSVLSDLPSPMQEKETSHNHRRVFQGIPSRPRLSPRQRIAKLAEECGGVPNWCLGPASEWIVVRCHKEYKHDTPLVDLPFSHFMNGSFAQKTSSDQNSAVGDCSVKSESSELKGESSLGIHCQELGTSNDDQIENGPDGNMDIHQPSQSRGSTPSGGSHGFCKLNDTHSFLQKLGGS